MTSEVRESCHIEISSELNKGSHQLDTESAHYDAFKAKLGQVDLRCEELLKEL